MKLTLPEESSLIAFGQALAAVLVRPEASGIQLITLSGDLGAGKTTLVRAMLHALGHPGRVKSPTFTLVEPYRINGRPIYHLDLYRLSDPQELEFLGFEDYLVSNALCLIEWPEQAAEWLPDPDMEIRLHHQSPGRGLDLTAHTPAGQTACERLQNMINSNRNFLQATKK